MTERIITPHPAFV